MTIRKQNAQLKRKQKTQECLHILHEDMHVTNEIRKCAQHHLQLGKLKFHFTLIKMTLVPINLTIPVASKKVEYQIAGIVTGNLKFCSQHGREYSHFTKS